MKPFKRLLFVSVLIFIIFFTFKEVFTQIPEASFSVTPNTGLEAPAQVQFTDTSTNSPTWWLWEFGDGNFSLEQNPIHTYEFPGTYKVKLTVANIDGLASITTDVLTDITVGTCGNSTAAKIDQTDYNVTGFFANKELVIQLTAYLFSAFAGVPIIYYAQKFWCQEINKSEDTILYPDFMKRVPGYFERFLATLGIVWAGWWLFLAIFAFIPRIVLNWKDKDRIFSLVSAAVGLILSILCGITVHIFV